MGESKALCPVSLPALQSPGIAPGTPQDRLGGEVGAGAAWADEPLPGPLTLWPQAPQAEGQVPEPGWGLHVRPRPIAGVPGVASLDLDPAPNAGVP